MSDSQMPRDWEGVTIIEEKRPPFFLVAAARATLHRVFGFLAPPWQVNWSETAWDIGLRFFWGLLVGAAVGFFLIPTVFWPSRSRRAHKDGIAPTLWERLDLPFGPGVFYLLIILTMGVIWMLRTRVVVRTRNW